MLSLCMIVKNEKKNIQSAILSVRDIVDEIVVVDTGSTDGTPELAGQLGAKVLAYKWTDDFSAARNFSLDHAKGDWILFMDADEIIAPSDATKIPQLCENDTLAGYLLIQRNYTNDHRRQNFVYCCGKYPKYETTAGYIPVERIGLFRHTPQIRFSGIIHETVGESISRIGGVVAKTSIAVHHYGHLDNEIRKTKTDYYLQLGLRQIELTPYNPKPYYDIGLIYINRGDFINAEKFFLKACQLNDNYEDILFNLGLLYFKWHKFQIALEYLHKAHMKGKKQDHILLTQGVIHDCLRQFDMARELFEEGVERYPDNRAFKENLAFVMLKLSQPQKAYVLFEELLAYDNNNPNYLFGAIQSYYSLKNFERALELIAGWSESGKFDERIAMLILKVYADAQQWELLEEYIAKLAKRGYAGGEISFYRGILFERQGNSRQALVCYKESLRHSPYLAEEINRRIKTFIAEQ